MIETLGFEENRKSNVRKHFETELRKNGFGFQYSVIKKIKNIYNQEESAWLPVFSEFPVEVNNNNTHIDFILERKGGNRFSQNKPFFMICECKRANPALSNWCFVRSLFARKGISPDNIFIESLAIGGDLTTQRSYLHRLDTRGKDVFDIAFNVKSDEKGEGDTKGANDAVSQVLRGMNGFIEYFSKKEDLLKTQHQGSYSPYFLPVIFTTAELWTSTIKLSDSDLNTGNLDLPLESLANVPWLLFQYNQSQPIKHSMNIYDESNDIFNVAESEFTRTVAIVNPKGIADFLYFMSCLDPKN